MYRAIGVFVSPHGSRVNIGGVHKFVACPPVDWRGLSVALDVCVSAPFSGCVIRRERIVEITEM